MTRKDYQHLASILSRIDEGLSRLCQGRMDVGTFRMQFVESFVPNIADELAEMNPGFDREKFIQAIKLLEPGEVK